MYPVPLHTVENQSRWKIAKKVLERFVLSLSDQQLVTGIAILSAGWIRHSKEKVYDFQMITDLAWMSSNAICSPWGSFGITSRSIKTLGTGD
jgi:hypothetical protein